MRITKQRTLTGLILAVLMALPFVSIASRVIYVQANKNAYQSYSQVESVEEVKINSINEFDSSLVYTWNYKQTFNLTSNTGNLALDYLSLSATDLNITQAERDSITKWQLKNNNYIGFKDTNNNDIVLIENTQELQFNFVGAVNSSWIDNANITRQVITTDKLDNVFEYSVSQFVKDNNFGKVDMTSWFADMFLDNNAHNNLYVNFVNWYLNYAMLITLMHFLFAVLMWFINYCRRLLDRGMNYDW